MVEFDRKSGILLHVTSLPSPYGIGDLGPEARRFVDFLARSAQGIWQVLPLNPTDPAHSNSPYSSASAFAGNRLLISPDLLVSEGLLSRGDLLPVPPFPDGRVDFTAVSDYKDRLLSRAWEQFRGRPDHGDFSHFCRSNAAWLDDYALFVNIRRTQHSTPWNTWPTELRDRHPAALAQIVGECADGIARVKFEQYLFFRQWKALKSYANNRGVEIFGDVPIYVNYDSVDTWSHSDLFKLDANKRPLAVAGVPPDYFSRTGQRWGNPVYDWERLRETGFRWWIQRLEHVLRLFDLVRIDHFRGLVAYWEIPAGQKTAQKGEWVPVPCDSFFTTLLQHFPRLPVVAEDLGTITDDVADVMKRYGFPGMKVLMFAFGDDDPNHPYRPHTHPSDAVVYTGTHDNNTVRGWWGDEAGADEKSRLFAYLGGEIEAERIPWAMIRLAMRSKASLAIFPMQDVLGLEASARMNKPATRRGNWLWRLTSAQLAGAPAGELADLAVSAGRAPKLTRPLHA